MEIDPLELVAKHRCILEGYFPELGFPSMDISQTWLTPMGSAVVVSEHGKLGFPIKGDPGSFKSPILTQSMGVQTVAENRTFFNIDDTLAMA